MIRSCREVIKPLAGGLAIALLVAPVIGAPAVFHHQGRILGTTGAQDPELAALVGEDLSVEYTVNPATLDADPDPTRGQYFDPLGTVRVTVGSNVYTSNGVSLLVEETQQGNLFSLSQIVSGNLFAGATQAAIGLTFLDPTGSVLKGDRLPLVPPSPADFGQVGLALAFGPPADDLDPILDDFDLRFGPSPFGPPADDVDIEFDFIVQDDDDPMPLMLRRFDSHSLRAAQVRVVPEPATVVTAMAGLSAAAAFLIRRRFNSSK